MIEPRITQDSTQMSKVMAHVHRNATETSRNAKDVVKIIVDELVSPCKKKKGKKAEKGKKDEKDEIDEKIPGKKVEKMRVKKGRDE